MVVLQSVETLVGAVFGGLGSSGGVGGGLGSLLGSLFGGSGASGFSGGISSMSFVAAGAGHSGAVIGGLTTGNRLVDMSVFAGAARYNGGGTLGYNEVPFIGLRDEEVLSPQESKAYRANRGGGGGANVVVNVPVSVSGSTAATDSSDNGAQTAQHAKILASQVKAFVRSELQNQTRYRGILNPG